MAHKRLTLLAVILASGTVFLDTTIVNVALPAIGRDLPAFALEVLEGQAYVYYGYLLSLSALLIPAGAMTDRFGRRRMFAMGLVAFGVTSMLCGAATSMEMLVGLRILQGAAGAFLVPGSLSIITSTFEGAERGRAFGIWAGATAATTILGPVVGGALIASVSWRAAFFLNIPLIGVALWVTHRGVDESKSEQSVRGFDVRGAIVATVAIGGLTFGAIRGQAQEWKDAGAYVALAAGSIALIALPALMRRAPNPLVPLHLFRSRNFTIVNVATFLIYGALYVKFQYQALFAIGIVRYSEIAFAISVLPASLLLALFSSKSGTLAGTLGVRRFMTAGPALMGLGIAWYLRFPRDSAPWNATLADPSSWVPPLDYALDFLPAELVFGVGLTIMVAPLTTALMQSVSVSHSGLASAINNAISRVGPQLLGALIFIAISWSFYSAISRDLPQTDYGLQEVREQVSPLNRPPANVPAEVSSAAKDASVHAFRIAMGISALLCIAGAVVNAAGIRDAPARSEDNAEGEIEKAGA